MGTSNGCNGKMGVEGMGHVCTKPPGKGQKNKGSGGNKGGNTDVQCAAHHGKSKPCCGQGGGTVSKEHQCPKKTPTCVGYEYGKKWGSCEAKVSTGSKGNKGNKGDKGNK